MTESDFVCNFKTCRRPLVNTGWVTSCSHVFCEEDACHVKIRQDSPSKCPVCETSLINKYDVVHVNFNPTEEYKSMVLAGLRPEMILEITSRAISFWAYQVSSERSNQERAARKAANHMELVKATHDVAMNTVQAELTAANKKTEALENENEALRSQLQGLRDTLADRGRQLHKLQSTLNTLRRSAINKSCDASSSVGSDGHSPCRASPRSSPGGVFSMEQSQHMASPTPKTSHGDSGFSFKPTLNVGARCNVPFFQTTNK